MAKKRKTEIVVSATAFSRSIGPNGQAELCTGHSIVVKHVSGITATIEIVDEPKQIVGVEFRAKKDGSQREEVLQSAKTVQTSIHTFYIHQPTTGSKDIPLSLEDSIEAIYNALHTCSHDKAVCSVAANLLC